MSRACRLLVAAALLTTIGSCADGDETSPDVEVTLQQYRSDEVQHIMGVQVTNLGEAPIDVASVQLDWPGLKPVEPRTVDYALSPGVTVDLPIDYGDAVCSDPPQFVEPTPHDAIRVRIVTAGGARESWPVDDARGVLTRVYELDCRRQAMEYRVDVAIGRTWTLNVAVADGAPTTMDGDQLTIPIVVTSTGNCTGHALADSKKTFDFQVTLEVDGDDASISIAPDVADQQIVYEPVNVSCGLTG